MAAAVKTGSAPLVSIAVGTSNAVGATTSGTEIDLSTKLEQGVMIRLTNGATGPTIGATADIQIKEQYGTGTNWRSFGKILGSSLANDILDQYVKLPDEIVSSRVVVSGNTGQAVVCEAIYHSIALIS